MKKVQRYAKYVKNLQIFYLSGLLFYAMVTLVNRTEPPEKNFCIDDISIANYSCWHDKFGESLTFTEKLGFDSHWIWLPLFILFLYSIIQFIGIARSIQNGAIFTNDNARRFRKVGYIYLTICFGQRQYIGLGQLLAKLIVPKFRPEVIVDNYALTFGIGDASLTTALMFLILSYGILDALQMKQDLETVV